MVCPVTCWHDAGDCRKGEAAAARKLLDLLASFAQARGLAPESLYGVAAEPKHPGVGRGLTDKGTLNYSYEADAPVAMADGREGGRRGASRCDARTAEGSGRLKNKKNKKLEGSFFSLSHGEGRSSRSS